MLTLRPAQLGDAPMLHEWRNAPDARAVSSDPREIPFDLHCAWVAKQVAATRDNARLTGLYLAMLDETPIGYGRIDVWQWPDHARLSYLIASEWRGNGYGKQLAALLVAEARRMQHTTISCRIKRDNWPSIVAAATAGVDTVEFFL